MKIDTLAGTLSGYTIAPAFSLLRLLRAYKASAGTRAALSLWFGQNATIQHISSPVDTVTNMKQRTTSKHSTISPEAMAAALEAAPDQVQDPDTPYGPNDPEAVEAHWDKAMVTHSKEELMQKVRRMRGKNKQPTKEQVSVRYSPEVLDYFRSTGKGWQTRMDEVLKNYVEQQKIA